MNNNKCIVVSLLSCLLFSSVVHANVLIQHTGSNNPLTEGWIAVGPSAGNVTWGAINDNGVEAWYVDDNSGEVGGARKYVYQPTANEVAQSVSYGWSLRGNLRVVDIPDHADQSVTLTYVQNGLVFSVGFGATEFGDPIVHLFTDDAGNGIQYTLTGEGSGYHSYELANNHSSGTVSFFVDDVQLINNWVGYRSSSGGSSVTWGSFDSIQTGQGNYNSVQFGVAPEPISSILFLTGGVTLIGRQYLRRRKIEV